MLNIFTPPLIKKKKHEDEVEFWNRIMLEYILYYIFLLTTVVVFPSAIGAFLTNNIFVLFFNIFVYGLLIFIYFYKRLKTKKKILILTVAMGITGMAMLLALGPIGAGFIWLFAFSSIASLFYGHKGNNVTQLISLSFVLLIILLFNYSNRPNLPIFEYTQIGFILTYLNYVAVSYLINISFIFIIKRHLSALTKEQRLTKKYKEKSDELENSNAQLDKVVYSISHDVRAPLTNIIGLTTIYKEESDPALKEFYLNKIEESAENLEKYTRQVINFFKTKKIEISYSDVHLKSEFDKIFNNYLSVEERQNIEIRLNFNANEKLKTSSVVFDIVFSNLISNAFKYRSEERPLEIEITTSKKEDVFSIAITDNGIGIPSKKVNEIFQVFTTGNNSIEKGAGIGLYLVKESLKMIDAKIDLSSTINKGSSFTVEFPLI